ncbi:EAL domain-containing protein [Undibacterium piscinae]|jgi:diguanylate cyclase (GGDEF)-like protein/PAS domain S-box-containing protein|uniref:EAL domain-containing protein n=1 Tax=Undibacterium piscinae TaxID=2495591 RepID=A0A6M4A890_9BURK|nr:EAL domain-containing protein [Undibacterium piscinae]
MERVIRHREPWDVPTRAFLFCVSLIVLAIMGQTWWSVAQDRVLTLSSAQENSFLAVRILEEHANRILRDAARAIGNAGEEIQSEGDKILHDEAAIRQVLINQRQDSQFLQAISIISPQGILRASSFQFPAEPIDLRVQQHVIFLLEHPEDRSVVVGKPVQITQTQRWVLPVAKNIYSAQGKHIGLIQTEINLNYFKDFYERVAKDGIAVISLHSKDGSLFLRAPYDERYLNASIGWTALVAAIKSDSLEAAVMDAPLIGGDARLVYTYRKMTDFPLTLVYGRDIDDILEDWSERVRQKLFFSALTVLFIVILGFLLMRQIRRLRASRAKLADSESRYRLLFLDAQDAILLINRDYMYVDCNKGALTLFGLKDASELLGTEVGRFSPERQPGSHDAQMGKSDLIRKFIDATFDGIPQRFDWVIKRDGILLYSEVTLSQIEIADDILVFCVMRDVNARKYVEHLLEGQNQLLQLIGGSEDLLLILGETCQFVEKMMPHWRCGIQLLDQDQRCFKQVIGPQFPDVLMQQLVDMPVSYGNGVWSEAVLNAVPVWITDIQHSASMQFVNQLEDLRNFSACGAWPIMGKNGQLQGTFTLFVESSSDLSSDDLGFISITTDIASIAIEGKRAEEKVLKLAHYDELTGLPNRFLYNQHLSKSLAYASRNRSKLAVLFLDLDRFKNINDTFGHNEGDLVLRSVAQRFRQCLRISDTIARVGGDEFILLVDEYNEPRDLGDIADKLLIAAALPFDIHGQECQLSASIGIATYPDDGGDAQTLMKNADIAMYRAKNKGKDNYQFYASEMNVHTIERLAFEARLRRALERREFVVYYQPKVSLFSGRIVGAEALVRWNHPERGILLPGEFIALAEEAGLVGRMGMLVLDIACRDILAFRAADKSFGRVAINLSGAQFNDVRLLEDVQSVTEFWRVAPASIEFEITESMVMHNREQAIVLMDGLKKAGFTLSIDDFGTGYSSLAYLKRFPVDSVKIDRSFIKDIPDDPNDTAIVLAIVAMAHTLGLKVIAEGVETPLQLQTLIESRCDEYQGFYFSKAIPESDFLQLLQKQSNTSPH